MGALSTRAAASSGAPRASGGSASARAAGTSAPSSSSIAARAAGPAVPTVSPIGIECVVEQKDRAMLDPDRPAARCPPGSPRRPRAAVGTVRTDGGISPRDPGTRCPRAAAEPGSARKATGSRRTGAAVRSGRESVLEGDADDLESATGDDEEARGPLSVEGHEVTAVGDVDGEVRGDVDGGGE